MFDNLLSFACIFIITDEQNNDHTNRGMLSVAHFRYCLLQCHRLNFLSFPIHRHLIYAYFYMAPLRLERSMSVVSSFLLEPFNYMV